MMNLPPPADMTPDWKPDPAGRYELRYWNGSAWSDDVSSAGQTMKDTAAAPAGYSAPAGGYAAPQPVPYSYGTGLQQNMNLAEPGTRLIARLIDYVIMVVGIVILIFILFAIAVSDDSGAGFLLASFLGFIAFAIVGIGYEVVMIALRGATIGKQVMGLRVVREIDGQIPGWTPSLLRWAPNLAGILPFGGIIMLLANLYFLFTDPRRQDVYDKVGKTLVINVK